MWKVLCMKSIFIRFFGNLAPMLGSLNTYTPWWCNVVPSTHMESSIFEFFCCNFKVGITKVRIRIVWIVHSHVVLFKVASMIHCCYWNIVYKPSWGRKCGKCVAYSTMQCSVRVMNWSFPTLVHTSMQDPWGERLHGFLYLSN
jgi:hypothetical protein